MPAKWDWPLAAPVKLQTNAFEVVWNPDPQHPQLPPLPFAKTARPERMTLIPYGCTKFRISMFPVTAAEEVQLSAVRRVLFLGNSITLHGPKADIGWTGNWGMAASAEENDYVHLVTSALAQYTESTPQILVRNIADFERNYATYDVDSQMKEFFEFDPDVVVLAIGENVPALESEKSRAEFKAGVMNILRCAGETPSTGRSTKLFLAESRQRPRTSGGLSTGRRHICRRRSTWPRCRQRGAIGTDLPARGSRRAPGRQGNESIGRCNRESDPGFRYFGFSE